MIRDSARLRRMLRAHQEASKTKIVDPNAGAKRLAGVIADCGRKRAKNQETFRAGAMTLEARRAAPASLDRVLQQAEDALRDDAATPMPSSPSARPW